MDALAMSRAEATTEESPADEPTVEAIDALAMSRAGATTEESPAIAS